MSRLIPAVAPALAALFLWGLGHSRLPASNEDTPPPPVDWRLREADLPPGWVLVEPAREDREKVLAEIDEMQSAGLLPFGEHLAQGLGVHAEICTVDLFRFEEADVAAIMGDYLGGPARTRGWWTGRLQKDVLLLAAPTPDLLLTLRLLLLPRSPEGVTSLLNEAERSLQDDPELAGRIYDGLPEDPGSPAVGWRIHAGRAKVARRAEKWTRMEEAFRDALPMATETGIAETISAYYGLAVAQARQEKREAFLHSLEVAFRADREMGSIARSMDALAEEAFRLYLRDNAFRGLVGTYSGTPPEELSKLRSAYWRNRDYLYWSWKEEAFRVDEDAREARIPTKEYREMYPWQEEE